MSISSDQGFSEPVPTPTGIQCGARLFARAYESSLIALLSRSSAMLPPSENLHCGAVIREVDQFRRVQIRTSRTASFWRSNGIIGIDMPCRRRRASWRERRQWSRGHCSISGRTCRANSMRSLPTPVLQLLRARTGSAHGGHGVFDRCGDRNLVDVSRGACRAMTEASLRRDRKYGLTLAALGAAMSH